MAQDTAARTQDQIVARMHDLEATGEDFFGFAREVLVDGLDYEHARPYLKPETTAEEWGQARTESLEEQARGYVVFAVGKIADHRGISASRSASKLTEYAWLLGRDDVVAAMGEADYPQYGAPKVKAFALGMGWADLWPSELFLERMAAGDYCEPGCDSGCGS